jgi:alpha,alpha-trehalase
MQIKWIKSGLAIVARSFSSQNMTNPTIAEAEKLYLNEKYLRIVKLADPSVDSKSVVDRATKRPLNDVLDALRRVNEANLDDIKSFVLLNLHEPGYEIERAKLVDWKAEPTFIRELKSDKLVEFSLAINRIWLDLYKKCDHSKLDQGCVSSHLPMKHAFIVPGGEFREIYYWDTYWTIRGLLVCGMYETTKQMLENFVQFIRKYGFIPNGSRVYYLNRSQPPYFAQMVMAYYEYCMQANDLSSDEKSKVTWFVLGEAFDCIVTEYKYWMEIKRHQRKSAGPPMRGLNVIFTKPTQPGLDLSPILRT